MSHKRPRTGADSPTAKGKRPDDKENTNLLSGLQRHGELWFDDGTIVLATDVHLFRLHKGILSKYSSFFRDLFRDLTQESDGDDRSEDSDGGGSSNRDGLEWDGVPVFRFIGDKDEDVVMLLNALYDRNFRDSLDKAGLLQLSSLLLVSLKYTFRDIRSDGTKYLIQFFPDTHRNYAKSLPRLQQLTCSQLFDLLNAAWKCDIHVALPALLYLCASQPIEDILSHLNTLPKDFPVVLLKSRETLIRDAYRMILYALQADRLPGGQIICKEASCVDHLRAAMNKVFDYKSNACPNFPLDVWREPEALKVGVLGLCKECLMRYAACHKMMRQDFWERLPQVFELGTWDELKTSTRYE